MNKRKKIIIIGVSCFLVVVAIGLLVWFKQYYDDRYVVVDYYYTIVPWDYDNTPRPSYNSDGILMAYIGEYNLIGYNGQGQQRELNLLARLNFQDLYPAGTYIEVSVSKTLVVKQRALPEKSVPLVAKEKIKENFIPIKAINLEEFALERTAQLSMRNTENLTISCEVDEAVLVYRYCYRVSAKQLAQENLTALTAVYRSQFRADQEIFPDLQEIKLEVILDDGVTIFEKSFNTRVKFGYELD